VKSAMWQSVKERLLTLARSQRVEDRS